MNKNNIRTAHSLNPNAREAVIEFHAKVAQPDIELVVFFCSSEYDLEILAPQMDRLFVGIQVVGVTTAGEIGPAGCRQHSLSGVSFSSKSVIAVTDMLTDLDTFDNVRGDAFTQKLLQQLESKSSHVNAENSFAFLMIDGLSMKEERVSSILQNTLGRIPMLGGSAGDDLHFQKTYVYFDGQFHSNSAVLIVINTTLPFEIFKTQHFIPTNTRLVVTAADPDKRIVMEVNGSPAATEYARLVGIDVNDLDPMRFATYPLVVHIGDLDFVRSIQKANPDGSLTFYCAIEEGLVLRLVEGVDIIKNVEHALKAISETIGQPQVVLVSDCK